MTYSFLNDYSEGCHPAILAALTDNNDSQQGGYGADDYCEVARAILREKMHALHADIHFVTGGTQANLVCLAAALRPFEAIIAAETGHIAANEAGAIEATGHKIITRPSKDGKLTVPDIESALKQFARHPHMVRPKLVYLSNTTELGTVYSKVELTALSTYCRAHDLLLFIDGARLGMALASRDNDLTLADIAELTDIFWLGGTKMGALLGEAIVITNDTLKADFAFHLKQRGALLAKGRVLGIQFIELLRDDRYLLWAAHANRMASRLADACIQVGYNLIAPVQSNQVFVELPHELITKLQHDFAFYEWEKRENSSVVRFVTSWATKKSAVEAFSNTLNA